MAVKKVKLADVLWDAANKHLSSNAYGTDEVYEQSCCAVYYSEIKQFVDEWDFQAGESKALDFLEALGCSRWACGALGQFVRGMDRQGVRYMWLLLAMHVAEDEGIEIEVDA